MDWTPDGYVCCFYTPMEKYSAEHYLGILDNADFLFRDEYGLQYVSIETQRQIEEVFSGMRRDGHLTKDEYDKIIRVYNHIFKNRDRIRDLDREQPRVIAQKVIGKKELRDFIFKRDGYRCLCCFSEDNLTIDHVIPISKNGSNEIDNFQTLCKSCNSRKSRKIIDYRNG